MSTPLPQKLQKQPSFGPKPGPKGGCFLRGSGAQKPGRFVKKIYTIVLFLSLLSKCTNIARKFLRLFPGCFSTISLKMAENVVLFLYKLLRDMGGQPKAPIGKR